MSTQEAVEPGLGTRLIGAAGRVTVGNVLSRVLSFITGIAAARILTTVEFGGFGAVQGAVSLAATLSSLSLGIAATRYVAKYRADDPERSRQMAQLVMLIATVSSVVSGLGLFLSAPWIARSVLAQPFLENPMRLASLLMVGTVVSGVASGVLLGLERFTAGAVTAVVQNAVILAGVLSVGDHLRLTGTIAVHALGFGAALLLSLVFLKDLLVGVAPKFRERFRENVGELARFCLPHTLGAFAIMPAVSAGTVLLARSQPAGYSELGFFTAGQRFFLLISFVSNFLMTALFPLLSRLSSDEASSRKVIDYGVVGTGLLILPLCTAMAFAAPLLMRLFGPAYESHWVVLLPIIAWAAHDSVGGVLGISLISHGHQWFRFFQQGAYAVALVGFALALRSFGAPGLAGAHLASVTLVAVLSVRPILRVLPVSRRAMIVYAYAATLPLGAGAVSLAMEGMWRWVAGTGFTAATLLLILALLTAEERARLLGVRG